MASLKQDEAKRAAIDLIGSSTAISRGLIEAACGMSRRCIGARSSTAISRGLIEARFCGVRWCLMGRHPRRSAVASLKPGLAGLARAFCLSSTAISRGLIEAFVRAVVLLERFHVIHGDQPWPH